MKIRITTDNLFPPFDNGTEWDVVEILGGETITVKDESSGMRARVYDGEYEIVESDSESNVSENSESELSENLSEKLSKMNDLLNETLRKQNQEVIEAINSGQVNENSTFSILSIFGSCVKLMEANLAQADAINALAAEVADLRKRVQEGTQQPQEAPETNAGGLTKEDITQAILDALYRHETGRY